MTVATKTLNVSGLTPLTTIDYPGCLSAVIYTQGCNLRCQYCHNPELLEPGRYGNTLDWDKVKTFLSRRKPLLDAVVFSGGEPTVQRGLIPALEEIKDMGFRIGLHTAGTVPARLKAALPYLDWVGLDIKALPEYYPVITGVDVGEKCWRSLDILQLSDINYEVRTTVHWQLQSPRQILELAERLWGKGVDRFVIQQCRTGKCLNTELEPSMGDKSLTTRLYQMLDMMFPGFEVR